MVHMHMLKDLYWVPDKWEPEKMHRNREGLEQTVDLCNLVRAFTLHFMEIYRGYPSD